MLFPNQSALRECFTPTSPLNPKPTPSKFTDRRDNGAFQTWSAVDDVKNKAGQLSAEAQAEFSKVSAAAQAKNGKIELYSGKYYAACILGGVLACVRMSQ